MRKMMVMLLIVLFAGGSAMAFSGNTEKSDKPMTGKRGEMSEKRSEKADFRQEIYEANKVLIDGNRETIKKIGLEIEKV